jgi:hypothetical protein
MAITRIQSSMQRFAIGLAFAFLTALAHDAGAADDAVPAEGAGPVAGSRIAPAKLLNYTYERWQAIVAAQYGCANSTVIAADSYSLAFDGVIKERWQTRVCNFGRNFWVILSPDGNGGYVVSFGQ